MVRRQAVRGITWIEFSVVLLLISVLAVGLLSAVLQTERLAERSMFDWTVRNLKMGLRLKVAHLMMANRLNESNALIGSNPVFLLDAPVVRYGGEINRDSGYQGGTWHFDRSRGELVYQFHNWAAWPFVAAGPQEGRLSIRKKPGLVSESVHGPRIEEVELVVEIIN